MKIPISKFVIPSLLFSLIIINEIFYRKTLFNKSINFEKKLQSFFGKKFFKYYFRVMSSLGGKYIIIPLIIMLMFTPINFFIIELFIFSLSCYLSGFLKLIYGNPRPFWIDNTIKIDCEGSYGNPSGHSITSTSIYLSMCYFMTQTKFFRTRSIYWKILAYSIYNFFIFNIIFSRLYFGVHSINQVIFGFLLGLWIFYLVIFVFNIQKKKPKEFLDFIYDYFFYILSGYIILFFIAFPFYFLKRDNDTLYKNIINEICPKISESNILQNDSLYMLLIYLSFIGVIIGEIQTILLVKQKNYDNYTDDLINWHRYFFKENTTFLRYFGFIFVFSIIYILIYLIFIIIKNDYLRDFLGISLSEFVAFGYMFVNIFETERIENPRYHNQNEEGDQQNLNILNEEETKIVDDDEEKQSLIGSN